MHFGDDGFTGMPVHFEHVPVSRAIRAPVDDDGKRTFCALVGSSLGSCVETLGQRVQGERHLVGNECPGGGGDQMLPGFASWAGSASVAFSRFQPSISILTGSPAGHPAGRCWSRRATHRG